MSEYTAHPTQPGNTHELTSPGTLNYDITRSGSTRRWGTEPQMKSSGNGSNNTEQRRNPKIPCPEISGLLTERRAPFGGLVIKPHQPAELCHSSAFKPRRRSCRQSAVAAPPSDAHPRRRRHPFLRRKVA